MIKYTSSNITTRDKSFYVALLKYSGVEGFLLNGRIHQKCTRGHSLLISRVSASTLSSSGSGKRNGRPLLMGEAAARGGREPLEVVCPHECFSLGISQHVYGSVCPPKGARHHLHGWLADVVLLSQLEFNF